MSALHPSYGDCDTVGPGGTCAECNMLQKIKNERARQPAREPRMAYVITNSIGQAVFSAPDFERAMERLGTLMRCQIGMPDVYYRIEKVEAE